MINNHFKHKCDLRNDRRVTALRRRHGLQGYAVYMMLNEAIGQNESCSLSVSGINNELVAGEFGVDASFLSEVIVYCCDILLLDTNLSGELVSVYYEEEFLVRVRKAGRKTPGYKKWRMAVFAKVGNQCHNCGETDNLQVHHIKSYRDNPEQRFDVKNGMVLCAACHKEVHSNG